MFARPQGRPAKTWPVLALSSLSLGRILGSGPPLQVLDQVLEEFRHALKEWYQGYCVHVPTRARCTSGCDMNVDFAKVA